MPVPRGPGQQVTDERAATPRILRVSLVAEQPAGEPVGLVGPDLRQREQQPGVFAQPDGGALAEVADGGGGVPGRNTAGNQHVGRVVAGQRVFEGGREALSLFRPHPVQLLQPRRADLLRPGDPRCWQLGGQAAAEAWPQARRAELAEHAG